MIPRIPHFQCIFLAIAHTVLFILGIFLTNNIAVFQKKKSRTKIKHILAGSDRKRGVRQCHSCAGKSSIVFWLIKTAHEDDKMLRNAQWSLARFLHSNLGSYPQLDWSGAHPASSWLYLTAVTSPLEVNKVSNSRVAWVLKNQDLDKQETVELNCCRLGGLNHLIFCHCWSSVWIRGFGRF